MGRTACTDPQYLYKGDLYPYHILVSLYNIRNFGQILIELEISRQTSGEILKYQFHEMRTVRAEVFHADRRMDG
jgi:hypothetical protein